MALGMFQEQCLFILNPFILSFHPIRVPKVAQIKTLKHFELLKTFRPIKQLSKMA